MFATYSLHRDTVVAPGWLRILLPVLLLVPCHAALALGVGEPQLLSGYAEPLRVRVPVSLDTAEERAAADSIRAELIPESEYARYGVAEQSIDVGGVYASSHASGSRAWIDIGSRQAIREPAAILLLRVRLGSTLIVKEVPLLFDFNAPPAAAEEPAVAAAAPAIDVAAVPAAPATPAAASAAPAPRKPRPARREKLPAPAAAAPMPAAAPAPLFTLGPGVKYTSAVIGLRLAESFDSLAEWQGTHPQNPAPLPAPAPQPEAVQAAVPQPRLAASPVPVAPEAAEASRWVWISWSLTAAILVVLWLLLRRKPARPHSPGVAEPAPAAAAPLQPPVAGPAANDPAAPIRERLRKLSRGKLDQDLARRVLLVDAFLDLKRYDSAERLLLEVEQELAAHPQSREGRADVAAAVRR